MPHILKATQFGNPILRTPARRLDLAEIAAPEVQLLIEDMLYTLHNRPYGVGLAAPQVGCDIAIAIVGLKPTKYRPEGEDFEMVMINPSITAEYGRRTGMWEGCISESAGRVGLFAKALRYRKLKLQWYNEHGEYNEEIFEGLKAHVIQHEVDHLNGVLFVDRVGDTKTYMTSSEYRKRIAGPALAARKKRKKRA